MKLSEIVKIFHKHAQTSEAKINIDKTQSFALGQKLCTKEHDSFKKIVRNKVENIRQHFLLRERSTKLLKILKNPNKILDNLLKNYKNSLLGKIFKSHTHMLTLLYGISPS